MYARVTRPLLEAEKRRLRRLLAARPRLALRSPRLWIIAASSSAVLWGATVLASKLVLWPTVVWGAIAILLPLWIGSDEDRKTRACRRRIESALAADRAEELRVATAEAVALDEYEDLGEAWAFQVEPDLILLVGPRQDLPRGFPTTDFSLVQCRDEAGNPVEFWFELRGEPLAPLRRIPADARRALDLSRAPETLRGRLDRLEELLRAAS